MQTNFSQAALLDPRMRDSEKILRACVHCGFCTATCPTYMLLGDERDSPRGRIYLIKDMLEGAKTPGPEVVAHVDRCLSCLSCMTTCPSGVHYMHLVDHARAYIAQHYKRPWSDRLMRAALAGILPYRNRFRLALRAGALARPLASLLARLPGPGARLSAMLALVRAPFPAPPETHVVATTRRGRVALLEGCAQPELQPSINAAARRLFARLGVETVAAPGEACCGALVHHMGREQEALAFARRNVAAWTRLIEHGGLDAIVVTTSGCGATLKDYGFMLREDGAYAEKAARVSALAKDVSEYLATLDWAPTRKPSLTLAYHAACSLQHGQKITDLPKELLRKAGFVVRDIPEGHICCGSAGTYNILQPELAGRLRDRKLRNIARLKPQAIAAGNIGCLVQLSGGGLPAVHTIELLDWACGGPTPPALTDANLGA